MCYNSSVKIVIDQGDVTYCYDCYGQCDDCPIRYICYTNKKTDNILWLTGNPYLDLLMLRGRLAHLIGGQVILGKG